MPVGRRMPHSHHSGSVNANFSLVRQVFRRIPILEMKIGQGSIGGGQDGSVMAVYIYQLLKSAKLYQKYSNFENWKSMDWVRRGVSRQSIFASITSHSVTVKIFHLRLLVLSFWVISRYCDDKNQTNKTKVLQRILFEIIKCRDMCGFLVRDYLPQITRPLSAPFLFRTSIS